MTSWCEHCGDEFCARILDGERTRSDLSDDLPLVIQEDPALDG
jgi:hypothetical protein